MPELLLAHDLGTTGNKASLFTPEGRPLASASVPYDTDYPRPGWAEQDPNDWWRAVRDSTQELLQRSGRSPHDVAAVSFSGQMMACLPVDAQGIPLRKAIIWADQRAEVEAATLRERVGPEEIYRITGHRASASYTAAKLLWLRTHIPEVYQSTRAVVQAKDYVAYQLTGVLATDYSDASGTNLFDLRRRAWSRPILQALDLDPTLFPVALPSATIIGGVTAGAAAATGLARGTPVIIGGGDGACATAGAGVVRPGDAYSYLGSSSWIAYVAREPPYDPTQRTFTFAHLDPEYVFPTGTMQSAGGAYDWLARTLHDEPDASRYAELDALAAQVEPGAAGLLFLPYLIGERSPRWNPHARAAFVGLSMAHGRAEMARAVLEGVGYNLRIILDAFRAQGAQIPALRLIGGGARSAVWRQILADIYDLPILRPKLMAEATALGAAVAGGVAVGIYGDYGVAAELVHTEPGERPDPARVARYGRLRAVFEATYAALEPIYDQIAAL